MKVGLYIHLPFCVHRCVYCDFTVKLFQSQTTLRTYLEALIGEVTSKYERYPFLIDSIYIGGGTPSLYSPQDIGYLLKTLHQRFPTSCDLEITLEANPNSLTLDKLKGYREAGVNRLSIGIQSFHERHLKTLERIHSPQEAENALIHV